MENKGVEFSINTQPVATKTWTWDAGFNITYNKNKITNLTVVPKDVNYPGVPAGGIAGGIGGGFAQIQAVGYSKNTFNLYKQVYDAAGKPVEGVFVDQNGDGKEQLCRSANKTIDAIIKICNFMCFRVILRVFSLFAVCLLFGLFGRRVFCNFQILPSQKY